MATQSGSSIRVRFGNFELDLSTGELRRDGTSLKLQPQPARVLVVLVSRAGEVVTRQDLAQQVWGTETFVDYEQGLNFAIRHIRAVLEDDAEHPRFLETVPKRGYRFIGAIEGSSEEREAYGITRAAAGDGTTAKPARARRTWMLMAAAGAVFLVALALRYAGRERAAPKPSTASFQSIAVLPLANLSADAAQEYFSDGLTDELTTELAKIGGLRVISRTSVIPYKGGHKGAPQIGRELHVDAIVEGTVERVGARVRIRAQLIDAATDQHLWAQRYDRDVSDVLQLEGEVASDIAQQIGHVASEQRSALARSHPVPPAVHEDYLRGRYYWNKRTEGGLRKGIEYFQKAVDQDPGYALAYAGLADSYIMLANWGFAPPAETYPKAQAAARKALELDEQLAEAHTSLAYVTLLYEWDWAAAEKRFRKALALNPNYASAHHFYSICLATSGRHSEALAEIKRAQELDPLSLIVNDVVGWIYYEGRQYDQARQQYTRTLEMDASYAPALLDLGTSYLRSGEYDKAIAQFARARAVTGDNGVVLSDLAQAYASSGRRAKAVQVLNRVQDLSATSFVSPWDLSLIYLSLGDRGEAISLLQKAADEHVGWVVRLGVDPAFDSLRGEPKFQRLVRRIRIPESSRYTGTNVGGFPEALASTDAIRSAECLDFSVLQAQGTPASDRQHPCAETLAPGCYLRRDCAKGGTTFRFSQPAPQLGALPHKQRERHSGSVAPRGCTHDPSALRAKCELVHGGSARIDAEGDLAERFERGKLSFKGDVFTGVKRHRTSTEVW
jgi:TolB-like protein/DNA-binding winged helix-turn-helix (wHTH) protein/Tfp pilus assembly protein PilF